ncbi:hypothetical protein LMF32_00160 [Desemzia sp. C1]|uniref:hypothetical protein n=1 Tax=Desemzia sp. C1 TaxID=2892016 RepID=UPI001E49D600|nr:hypothetical protein [Desemzia sp. C1]MCI3027549.1 hypothetical protein [Desemzia sp. C1]
MNDTAKSLLKKFIWIVITFLFLEAILLMALEALFILSEYKLDITGDIVIQEITAMFQNLPNVIQTYWQEKNPFFILGTGAILIYSFVLHKGKSKKEGWDTEEKNAYHGSARWGTATDIFDKKNFQKQSKRDIQSEFMKSIKQ